MYILFLEKCWKCNFFYITEIQDWKYFLRKKVVGRKYWNAVGEVLEREEKSSLDGIDQAY